MSSIRVSNRLRAKRFKTGTATAEDKAYIEKKYGGPCDMNGYVSPFPPGEDPYVKEWTYTPLPSNYVEKKTQKKPKRALSKDNKVVEDRVRCEVIPLSKPLCSQNKQFLKSKKFICIHPKFKPTEAFHNINHTIIDTFI